MHDVVVFGTGVLVSGALLVLVRWARRSSPRLLDPYRPPPAGHQALVRPGTCAMTCSCGWLLALAWPPTSRRVNRARLGHYAAVEQEHLAQRLGVDAASMLEQVLTTREATRPAQGPPQLEAAPQPSAPRDGTDRPWQWPEQPARKVRVAADARRASAIARVEAGRALAKHTGAP